MTLGRVRLALVLLAAELVVIATNVRTMPLDIQGEVLAILVATLNLKSGTNKLQANSPLLGTVPELDSMAVAGVITSLEERFGFTIADDEIDGSTFATVGTLTEFVKSKLADSSA